MGKSTIAASVCRRFDGDKALGAHFFCKRDDPDCRAPEQVLNTIIFCLALQYEPYGKVIASAIEADVRLPEAPLAQRYTYLIEQPLRGLESKNIRPAGVCFVVVDALDECEKGDGRRLLLTYLPKLSQIVSWVRVVVTSRPDQDIKRAFGNVDGARISSHSLLDYRSSDDLFAFIQRRMSGIAGEKDQPEWSETTIQRLAERASGLFIWAETACKFIENALDMETALGEILGRTPLAEGSEPLDILYRSAIKHGMGDVRKSNVANVRQCLGAIVATAARSPLSVANLELLLSSKVKRGVFRNVVNGLGSVLYEDETQGGAVRVYHPSFADFILDPSRSKVFYTDPEEQNGILADCCLTTMMAGLKFNICALETSHVLNSDVPNLETRVQAWVGLQLQYSCLHWSSHLTGAPKGILEDLLGRFLYGRELMYWIEVVSLLSRLNVGISSLLSLVDWTSVSVWCEWII